MKHRESVIWFDVIGKRGETRMEFTCMNLPFMDASEELLFHAACKKVCAMVERNYEKFLKRQGMEITGRTEGEF